MKKKLNIGDIVQVDRRVLSKISTAPALSYGIVEETKSEAFSYKVRLCNGRSYYFHEHELRKEEERASSPLP